ncbi:GH1 family beta-glucosidase [Terracidiphilus gabretensis]|uniref:GH1 family beta-glucosidase n=1 Tax=Terracidiphilus gabretensis TaxID=1577687 RepID=UPI0009E91D49|nr:GH1 family beta-glucosidase [Terracidiphilus gabretensis]
MKAISRRLFGKTAAATAAAAATGVTLPGLAASGLAFGQSYERKPVSLKFPEGFKWGCSTASYQIEGAVKEDGRGETNWDIFAHTPGKTHNGDTGDVADDSYHRYKEDALLLKNLGVQTYRMSIAWSRIFPEGKGTPNPKGLDYYHRVVDDLLAKGITPYVTLFHWDLPAALPGGWQNRDTSKAFGDYAGYMAKHLGDKVKNWMTTNELTCFTDLGYRIGQFAPGLKLPNGEANQVCHHGILAHGLGVQAIRANAPSGTLVGLAENATVCVPVIETEEHIKAAQKATRLLNAQFLTAIMEGKYIEEYLKYHGADAPKWEPDDFKAIGSKLDFVGHNVYTPTYVRAADGPLGFAVVQNPSSYPHMASPWLNIGPESIYWAVRNVCELWHPPAMYITENGCSSDDVLTPEGQVGDVDRVMYLRNYVTQLHRAAAEGYPIKGYFLWSLLDNFEWADGYSKRFGIHYVDYKTLKRYPKLSAEWYKTVIARNAVV